MIITTIRHGTGLAICILSSITVQSNGGCSTPRSMRVKPKPTSFWLWRSRRRASTRFCTARDADPVTLQIQKACAEYKPTEEFPETFYKEVISKVILYRDTHIEFKLQNGQIV